MCVVLIPRAMIKLTDMRILQQIPVPWTVNPCLIRIHPHRCLHRYSLSQKLYLTRPRVYLWHEWRWQTSHLHIIWNSTSIFQAWVLEQLGLHIEIILRTHSTILVDNVIIVCILLLDKAIFVLRRPWWHVKSTIIPRGQDDIPCLCCLTAERLSDKTA